MHPCLVNDFKFGESLEFCGKILGWLRHFYSTAAAFLATKPQLTRHNPRITTMSDILAFRVVAACQIAPHWGYCHACISENVAIITRSY